MAAMVAGMFLTNLLPDPNGPGWPTEKDMTAPLPFPPPPPPGGTPAPKAPPAPIAGKFGPPPIALPGMLPPPPWQLQGQLPPGAWFAWDLIQLSRYIKDNFGLRSSLPLFRASIREALDSPDTRIVHRGRNGQLFWAREGTPEQSFGTLIRVDAVTRFVEMVTQMQATLSPFGARMVVALPPNAQSVDWQLFSPWSGNIPPRPSEYDLALSELKAHGITTVDLRAALRNLPWPRYLVADTHWNTRSSVAAFNAIMAGIGHPDWEVDMGQVVGPLEPTRVGDLQRHLKGGDIIKQQDFQLNFPPTVPERRFDSATFHSLHEFPGFNAFVRDYGKGGPRVLILGDSFTVTVWSNLFFNAKVSEVAWMHYSKRTLGSCDFDFNDVIRFRPQIVIVARAERFFPCFGDAWPKGLPRPDAS